MSVEASLPRVAVLLASYNGRQWIAEQLDSILRQVQVQVHVFVSDDLSSDGTWEWLSLMAQSHVNLTLLPQCGPSGSAGKNFYRLIRDVDIANYDFIAYADQDDIWESDKLSLHISLLQSSRADGVSSNVQAFWPNGSTALIVKSQPQRKYDYLFESAGPGCTFVMTPRLLLRVRALLQDVSASAVEVTLHDWLTYAVARSMGYTWVIDTQPSMRYRQHGSNVVGANVSLSAKLARLKKMRDGWYRQQIILITRIAYAHSRNEALGRLLGLLGQTGWGSRMKLLCYAWQGRRSVNERLYLMIAILMNWF